MLQPFPKFYLFRSDGTKVPLIPLDELPSWLQVGPWDWSDSSLFAHMLPACPTYTPRDGEYDVICYYCLSSVDSRHQSISQTHSTTHTPSVLSLPTKGDKSVLSFPCLPAEDSQSPILWAPPLSLPWLFQPLFHANLQHPFVGLCVVSNAQGIDRGSKPEPIEIDSESTGQDDSGMVKSPTSYRGPPASREVEGPPGAQDPRGRSSQRPPLLRSSLWFPSLDPKPPRSEREQNEEFRPEQKLTPYLRTCHDFDREHQPSNLPLSRQRSQSSPTVRSEYEIHNRTSEGNQQKDQDKKGKKAVRDVGDLSPDWSLGADMTEQLADECTDELHCLTLEARTGIDSPSEILGEGKRKVHEEVKETGEDSEEGKKYRKGNC